MNVNIIHIFDRIHSAIYCVNVMTDRNLAFSFNFSERCDVISRGTTHATLSHYNHINTPECRPIRIAVRIRDEFCG